MDPLSIGRGCYRKRDFEGALKAFTEGIKISSGHILFTALDHRAATLEKLNQFQAALKDAKEMIELKPELAKGYLRCAKILQLKGEENLALKIYERGLKKVKVGTDPDRLVLQDQFNKLQRKQIPAKNFDPMVMLPPELAQMVCKYMDMRDRVICLAVSRPWKRFLESSHDLWTVLDLRYARRLVRLDSLKKHLRRSNYDLDTAFLNMNPQILCDNGLDLITRWCKKLSYLEIKYHGSLGPSLVSALSTAQSLRTLIVKEAEIDLISTLKILTSIPQLQRTEFVVRHSMVMDQSLWPQLNSLTFLRLELFDNGYFVSYHLERLISCTPNLKTAILIENKTAMLHHAHHLTPDFSLWSQLEHLEFTFLHTPMLHSLPQTLKHLDISQTYREPRSLPPLESSDAPHLPLLETFSCQSDGVSLKTILAIISASVKAGNLQTLFISFPLADDDENFSVLPDDFLMSSVQAISITHFQGSENDILTFLRRCPSLRSLDVTATKITGVAVKELMTREVGPLNWLGASNCSHLSPDAVQWARSLGTVVECNHLHGNGKKLAKHRFWRSRQVGDMAL